MAIMTNEEMLIVSSNFIEQLLRGALAEMSSGRSTCISELSTTNKNVYAHVVAPNGRTEVCRLQCQLGDSSKWRLSNKIMMAKNGRWSQIMNDDADADESTKHKAATTHM